MDKYSREIHDSTSDHFFQSFGGQSGRERITIGLPRPLTSDY
jgi:hypothetical protein